LYVYSARYLLIVISTPQINNSSEIVDVSI